MSGRELIQIGSKSFGGFFGCLWGLGWCGPRQILKTQELLGSNERKEHLG
jgi:hypothetical protein